MVHSIKINRVFKTPDKIQKGLMFLRKLPSDAGALFVMPTTEKHSFWMKNTYVSLDVIFLDDQNDVVGFVENTTPLSLSSVAVNHDSKYIIEIKAGYVKKKNLQVGYHVKFLYTKNTASTRSSVTLVKSRNNRSKTVRRR